MKHQNFGRRDKTPCKVPEDRNEYVIRDRRERRERRLLLERRQIELSVKLCRRATVDRRLLERRANVVQKATIATMPAEAQHLSDEIPIYRIRHGDSPNTDLYQIKAGVHETLMEVIDLAEFSKLSGDVAKRELINIVVEILNRERVPVSGHDQRALVQMLVADIVGYGPLDPLLADPSVTDIMVNGPKQIWVERSGKLEMTDIAFDNPEHLMTVIQRIVSRMNRRIDESSPMVDARLPDGSRINVIIPPLSVRYPSISIRKFAKQRNTLEELVANETMSEDMAQLLQLAARYRLNILIAGGTGAGKTTLLNAIASYISPRERIVTIEDTAELQLQQPNVVSLESRPANIEATGQVTIGDLLINALRMRPDRIIVGEVRGAESGEMLQAMNTGHDGSFGTVHANGARDALTRFENMMCMGPKFSPGRATRQQIMNALDLVVHVSRMHDGTRRVMSISEIVGMDEELILVQDLYRFVPTAEVENGRIIGRFEASDLRPRFSEKLVHFDLSPQEKRVLFPIDEAA